MSEPHPLLAGLDEQQRQAAGALLGPVCLLAGAGTGKTRAITHRIAYGVATGVYDPEKVLALTFTNRAAGELRGRLRELGAAGVAARTFHSAALAMLGTHWPQAVGGPMPQLLEGKGRLLAHVADTLRLRLDTAALRDAAAEIEWRKTRGMRLDEYALVDRPLPPGLSREQLLDLQQAYERLKDERRRIDFEDVLLAAAGMIEAEPRVAAAVRERFRFFVVDEYQDVSPVQHALLKLWLGDRSELCVVGDVSQTIYTFAGADPDFLLGFAREHPDALVLRLEENYRSTPRIVAIANRLMRGRAGALELRAASGAVGPEPELTGYATDAEEAAAVAGRIAEQLAAGSPPESIAVLLRINAQAQPIEAALADAGVPFVVRGATPFFERAEVREAVLLLRGASVATAASEPLFKAVSDVLRSIGWSQTEPSQPGAVRDRWESLEMIMRLAEAAGPATTLREFVAELLQRQASQHAPVPQAVTVATLHSAKGLEWDCVHLVGLSEGLLPFGLARSDAAIEEERRLLYVGITRARRQLHLSWSASAGPGRPVRREPSRFVAGLLPGHR